MRRSAALAATVAGVLAFGVGAAEGNTYAENQRIGSALKIARGVWGSYPCRGLEVIRVVPNNDPALIDERGWPGVGSADRLSCRIWLSKDAVANGFRTFLCEVVTHEVGHLALPGEDDHRNPIHHGIMMGSRHPRCEALADARSGRRDARRARGQ